jgi:hypothetical protein
MKGEEAGSGSPVSIEGECVHAQRRVQIIRNTGRRLFNLPARRLLRIVSPGFTFPISPAQLERLALADRSGSKWVFFEGDEQCRDFIKLLALSTNTTEQGIMGRITRHPLSGAEEMMSLIMTSTDPSSLEEIERFCRKDQG